MSKLGQLYIQDGYSGDNQILSSEWIEQATSSAVSTGLQPLSGYGYLFLDSRCSEHLFWR